LNKISTYPQGSSNRFQALRPQYSVVYPLTPEIPRIRSISIPYNLLVHFTGVSFSSSSTVLTACTALNRSGHVNPPNLQTTNVSWAVIPALSFTRLQHVIHRLTKLVYLRNPKRKKRRFNRVNVRRSPLDSYCMPYRPTPQWASRASSAHEEHWPRATFFLCGLSL